MNQPPFLDDEVGPLLTDCHMQKKIAYNNPVTDFPAVDATCSMQVGGRRKQQRECSSPSPTFQVCHSFRQWQAKEEGNNGHGDLLLTYCGHTLNQNSKDHFGA